MSEVARKQSSGPATFFRVDGADKETGQETYLVLQATTKPQAEKLARKQGLLISSVRVARPDDWSSPAQDSSPAEPSTADMDIYTGPPAGTARAKAAALATAAQASAPARAPAPEEAPAAPSPGTFEADDLVGFPEPPPMLQEAEAPPPAAAPVAPAASAVDYRDDYVSETTPFIDPAPEFDEPAATRPAAVVAPAAADPVPAASADASADAPSASGGSSAAAVMLGCVGVALVVGGVLALSLALWPDNAVRNELQQIDYRLHEVSQTILGAMLVLGGLITFTLAIICHLLPKRTARR